MKNRRRALLEGGTKTTRLRLTLRLKDDTLPKPTHEDIFEIIHTKLDCFLTGIRDLNNGGFSFTSDMQSTIDSLVLLKDRALWVKLTWHQSPRQKSRQRGLCLSADWVDTLATVQQLKSKTNSSDQTQTLTTSRYTRSNTTTTSLKLYAKTLKQSMPSSEMAFSLFTQK